MVTPRIGGLPARSFPLHWGARSTHGGLPAPHAPRAPQSPPGTLRWQTGAVRVYLGSDHAGFELKARVIAWLREAGHEPVDCGPASYHEGDDYPVYVLRAARGVIEDPGSLGIVIGGSGNGEQIAANKVPG